MPAPFLAVGFVLLAKRHVAGLYLLLGASLGPAVSATIEFWLTRRYAEVGAEPWMAWALLGEGIIGAVATSVFAVMTGLFPMCVPTTRGQRWFARAMWLLPLPVALGLMAHPTVLTERLAYSQLPALPNPVYADSLAVAALFLPSVREMFYLAITGALVLLVFRYRRAKVQTRRPIRWVLFGIAAAVVIGATPFLVHAIATNSPTTDDSLIVALSSLAIPVIPLTILFALEPPVWLDADAVIRKSFIYGAMSFGIIAVYAAVAAMLGVTASAGMPVEAAIVLTAIFAVSFQPVRERLRAIADRWVFNAHHPDDAPAVERAETPSIHALDEDRTGGAAEADPSAAGQRLAQLVRAALRLHWVTVAMEPSVHCSAGV